MLHSSEQKKTTQKLELLGGQGRNIGQADFISFHIIPCIFTLNNGNLRKGAAI